MPASRDPLENQAPWWARSRQEQGQGAGPALSSQGGQYPRHPGSTVLTDLSSDTQPTRPPLWTRGCLTPTPDLDPWPGPAQLFLTSDQGVEHRCSTTCPALGPSQLWGGHHPGQALGFMPCGSGPGGAKQPCQSLGSILPAPCRGGCSVWGRGTASGRKRGPFTALPCRWDSGLTSAPPGQRSEHS